VADPTPVFEPPDVAAETVFLVEDEESVRELLRRVLTRSGYSVRAFSAPTEALAEFPKAAPKVILTDHHMPEMTGLQLAEKVLEMDPKVRVVLLTGEGGEETAQSALRLGLADYMVKPVGAVELAAAVQNAFLDRAREEYAATIDAWLRQEVQRQTSLVREVTLGALASLLNALEARSPHFKGHSMSVAVWK
jgi:DNA-binding NtrC family response regulator